MPGLDFLFSAALWALPLSAIPIALHLLYRRKSPVVMFSTIRFLQLSVQRTAARKKVHRWVLLACRALLLALLIGAVAQPRTRPASQWSASPGSVAASIVVDTSYSMELREGETTLIRRADAMIQELLSGELRDANVAVFRSRPADPSDPAQSALAAEERGTTGSRITRVPLAAQVSSVPLVDRVPAAIDFLRRSAARDQRLIVISDFQKREFPHPLPEYHDARTILIDLHPSHPRSHGITRIATDPPRPTPGIGSELVAEVAGPADSEPMVDLSITTLDDRPLLRAGPLPAKIDSSGYGRVRFPVRLPAERWMLLKVTLRQNDDMPWDDTRTQLVEVPPRQNVSVIPAAEFPQATRFLRLALDPSEGASKTWPITVRADSAIQPDTSAVVAVSQDWPDATTADRWLRFVREGGTLIWFVRPGLEATWAGLPDAQKQLLLALLPGAPSTDAKETPSSTGAAAAGDPLLAGLADRRYQIGSIVARRFIPFDTSRQVATALLNLFALQPTRDSRPNGLLFRRAVGSGTVFTFATIPEDQFTNLAIHPIFLPLLVRMALKPSGRNDAQNVELCQSISAGGSGLRAVPELWVRGPQNSVYPARLVDDATGRRFVLDCASAPGLYTWTRPKDSVPLAVSNVQLPAGESQLVYRPADTLAPPGPDVVVARSLEDVHGKIVAMSEPNPRWAIPIAGVMALLCLESLMGAHSGKWLSWRRQASAAHA